MVMRIASLGYQRGFGGHFHNDNSITALRDIPGLVVGCPSRGDDAAMMLRTLMALAKVDGRVCVFLEPIALYMTKDLYEPGDGQWLTPYPAPDQAMPLGEGRVYGEENTDLRHLQLRQRGADEPACAREIEAKHGSSTRVVDLRWLQPLNEAFIAGTRECKRILVVDEGRRSAGVGEGVITAIRGRPGRQAAAPRGRRRHLYAAGRRGLPRHSLGGGHRGGGRQLGSDPGLMAGAVTAGVRFPYHRP
jgi:2-oxoisovalerate dehydrogenase E1 component